MRFRFLLSLFVAIATIAGGVQAQGAADGGGRTTLGIGRLFSNDFLGDGRDRWQSGSYVISILQGRDTGLAHARPFGDIREYRLRTGIIANNGDGPAPGDRPYVGSLSFGIHSHFGRGSTRASLGVDVIATGPQTGVSQFQDHVHARLDMPQVPFTNNQLDNDLYVSLTAETAEVFAISNTVMARPFGEAQLGPEDMIRVGADIFVGGQFATDILIRDVTTGHLYRGTDTGTDSGFTFVFGADVASVADSIYLPGDGGAVPRDSRGRVRAGVHWQTEDTPSVFYGMTYLSPEFEGQPEGQITGSVRLNFNF